MNAILAALCAGLSAHRFAKGEDLLGSIWLFNAVANALFHLK